MPLVRPPPLFTGGCNGGKDRPSFAVNSLSGGGMRGRHGIDFTRRHFMSIACASSLALMAPWRAFAAAPDTKALKAAIDKQRDEAIKRLQDWIALPSIAAENRNSEEGVKMMMD